MGKQVVFFANANDFGDFMQFAEDSGFRALPAIIPTEDVGTSEQPGGIPPTASRRIAGFQSPFFYLMPDTVAPVEAFYHEITSKPCSSQLASAVSPVIQVKPSEIEKGSISDGRIYFNMDTHDVLNDKGDKAYAKCARYFRKWPKTREFNFRVGPKTAEEVRESTLRLVHWGRELEMLG